MNSPMNDTNIIATLNDLIEASKDGEKNMVLAAKAVRSPELARVLSDGEKANLAAAAELQDQVRKLGGTAEEEGSMRAAAHRGWTSVRSMLSSPDDMTILEECERGEGILRERYSDALKLDLPAPIRSMVERHHQVIVDNHYRVLDLRNRFRDGAARAFRAND
jgi:uncharacterized protein (TIGR02284 family)